MSPIRMALLLAASTAFALPSAAQDWRGTEGRMEGKVLDPAGQPIPGAVLKFELPGRGGTTIKADKKGRWVLGGIASGKWNVDVEAPGFTTLRTYLLLPSEASRLPPFDLKLEKAVDPGPPAEVMAAIKDAEALYDAGKYPEARVLYEKALADPKVSAQPAAKSALHMRIARAYSQEEQYEKELEHLQALLDMEPGNTQVITLMAQEAIKGGMLERGMSLLAKIDESQVKDPSVFFNVGVLFLNQGKVDDAVKYFTKSVTADPAFVDGYYQRGLAYLGQQKMAESKADFQKVLELAPDSPQGQTAKKALESLK